MLAHLHARALTADDLHCVCAAVKLGYLVCTIAAPLYLASLLLRIWTMTSWYQMEAVERRLLDVRKFCLATMVWNMLWVLII